MEDVEVVLQMKRDQYEKNLLGSVLDFLGFFPYFYLFSRFRREETPRVKYSLP